MSVSHPDSIHFKLNGKPVSSSYDEQADILYLWIGKEPKEAISVESQEGPLVRLHPETYKIVGVTIFDFCRRWQMDDPGGTIEFTLPSLGEHEGEVTKPQRFALVGA